MPVPKGTGRPRAFDPAKTHLDKVEMTLNNAVFQNFETFHVSLR